MIPKMIIFDAGRTLIDYKEINIKRGIDALMKYIVKNPRNLTVEDIEKFDEEIFKEFEKCRNNYFETPVKIIHQLIYDLLEIEFSISMDEVEKILWDESCMIETIPHSVELIDKLNNLGIRTAVISNIDFSSYLLKKRLDDLFTNNQFEFVIGSSDYGIRKPNKLLFDVGITKSGLSPEEIWYVGDKVKVDVMGSKASGMVSVLYKNSRNIYDEIPTGIIVINDMLKLLDFIE